MLRVVLYYCHSVVFGCRFVQGAQTIFVFETIRINQSNRKLEKKRCHCEIEQELSAGVHVMMSFLKENEVPRKGYVSVL